MSTSGTARGGGSGTRDTEAGSATRTFGAAAVSSPATPAAGRAPSGGGRSAGLPSARTEPPGERSRETDTISLVRPPTMTRSRTTKPDINRAAPERVPTADAVRPATPASGRAANATAAYERTLAAPVSAGTATAGPQHPVTGTSPDALASQFDAVAGDRPGGAPARGPSRSGSGSGSGRPPGAGRRAKLRLSKVNPITVTRLSFAFSLCVFVVLLVAVAVLWFVLNSIGVFDSVSKAADTLTNSSASDVRGWLSFGRAMEISLLIGAINVILMTALTTLAALLYNLCAEMIGGIELTLSDQ